MTEWRRDVLAPSHTVLNSEQSLEESLQVMIMPMSVNTGARPNTCQVIGQK